MDFDGSEAQKTMVINYITKNVYKQYCTGINMCQESMLRRMEQKDLDAFKLLTKADYQLSFCLLAARFFSYMRWIIAKLHMSVDGQNNY